VGGVVRALWQEAQEAAFENHGHHDHDYRSGRSGEAVLERYRQDVSDDSGGRTRKPVAKGDYIAAMGAVDNALRDIKGKALGQPVWKLAGGCQEKVLAYAGEGFSAVKMKVGWPGVTLRHDAAPMWS
jgi:L-alanine-DL-glutamate epimerase-like enolase superfamily enzyme